MTGSTKHLLAIAAAVVGMSVAACADLMNTSATSFDLSPAFQTTPAGFSANTNSFDPVGDAGSAFFPGPLERGAGFSGGDNSGPGGGDDRRHHDGFGGEGLRGLLMGGGLGPDFIGAIAFGKGRGRGPFGIFALPAACTYNAETGRVACPDRNTDRGWTISASFAFEDEAGQPQPKFDTLTTNSVNQQIAVAGTIVRRDSSTSTVRHGSDRTVEGLAPGKTERIMNGTASANESTTGVREGVAFIAERQIYDTTTNLVVPISDGRPTIATSGTVVRNMTVSITAEGGETRTKSRREEVTFDGTNIVKIKITQDGVTKNCLLSLPEKRLACE